MDTQRHTPGPWHTLCHGDSLEDGSHRVTIAGPSTPDNFAGQVATAWRKGASAEEVEANARLIAAAPDLLDALKGMMEWARRVRAANPGMEVAEAMNAIARVEGRA